MRNKPLITEELLNYLEKMFPEKCAELKQSEREIFYQSGQRSVVKHIREIFKNQLQE